MTTPQMHSPQTLTPEAFAALGGPALVYVRQIRAVDLLAIHPDAFAEDAPAPEQVLFAVHGADGTCMAVLSDRESAYAAALAHDLAPVSVH